MTAAGSERSETVDVCAADELEPGGIAPARLGMLPIVVVRTLDGELHGLVDRCLHQGARLSGGRLLAHAEDEAVGEHRMLDSREVLKCPWHGYEYDVRTGCAVFDRRLGLRRIDVRVEAGRIVASAPILSAS